MHDEGCSLDIRFAPGSRCEFRVRLDVPTADYRLTQGTGQTSKMCDFAAGGLQDGEFRVLVIELKGGAASRDAVDQLQEGLNLIRGHLDRSAARVSPQAYLVADKQTSQLKNLLRSSKERLRFGSSKLQLVVRRCGDSVVVGE